MASSWLSRLFRRPRQPFEDWMVELTACLIMVTGEAVAFTDTYWRPYYDAGFSPSETARRWAEGMR